MTDYCPHGVRRGVLCPDCWNELETEAAATAGVAAGLRLDVAYLRERLAAAEGLAGAVEEIAAKDRKFPDYDDGEAECAECHTSCQTLDGLDPAPECHPCSTALLEKARMIARAALKAWTESAPKPPPRKP